MKNPSSTTVDLGRIQMIIQGQENLIRAAAQGVAAGSPTPTVASTLWHLSARGTAAKYDLNVTSVWKDYTGKGVHVAVYDDAVDYKNADLLPNYDASKQIAVGGTSDAMPVGLKQMHGTAVAGVIAAALGGADPLGVAYGASITGIKVFDRTTSELDTLMARESDFDVVN